MDNSILSMILLQVALILLNAVFACAEIAVISINDAKLAKMAAAGDKRAVRLARLTSQPARFLATIQVAITLSGFLGSAFAAENFSDRLVEWLIGLGVSVPASTLDAIAVVIITLILSYFTLIFGELVPKRLAMRKAEALALGISGLVSAIARIFAPIVWLLTASTNGVLRLLGIDPNDEEESVSEEEIRMMVDVGTQKGTIDQEEKAFIQNVFEFDDLTAGEIATHRTDLTVLWLEEPMESWEATIHASRHTRYPVCGESADDVVGILNAKDYFRLTDRSREAVMAQAVEQPYFVPDSVKADVLFQNMRSGSHPLAVVLDEYGGMTGIITINDLVEQLVGDLGEEDMDQNAPAMIEKLEGETWRIRGDAPLEDVAQSLGIPLPCQSFDTFNGLVFGAIDTIPEDGTTLEVETAGLTIQVTQIRNHQIGEALVRLCTPGEPPESTPD